MILISACASEAPEPEIPSLEPTVATLSASALGTSAMTVNGSVHPHGKHTTYYFEYGSSTEYGSKTDARPLPPRLAAYYHETWDEGMGGWYTWLKDEHFTSGGLSNGYVRFHEPSNQRLDSALENSECSIISPKVVRRKDSSSKGAPVPSHGSTVRKELVIVGEPRCYPWRDSFRARILLLK